MQGEILPQACPGSKPTFGRCCGDGEKLLGCLIDHPCCVTAPLWLLAAPATRAKAQCWYQTQLPRSIRAAEAAARANQKCSAWDTEMQSQPHAASSSGPSGCHRSETGCHLPRPQTYQQRPAQTGRRGGPTQLQAGTVLPALLTPVHLWA